MLYIYKNEVFSSYSIHIFLLLLAIFPLRVMFQREGGCWAFPKYFASCISTIVCLIIKIILWLLLLLYSFCRWQTHIKIGKEGQTKTLVGILTWVFLIIFFVKLEWSQNINIINSESCFLPNFFISWLKCELKYLTFNNTFFFNHTGHNFRNTNTMFQ